MRRVPLVQGGQIFRAVRRELGGQVEPGSRNCIEQPGVRRAMLVDVTVKTLSGREGLVFSLT